MVAKFRISSVFVALLLAMVFIAGSESTLRADDRPAPTAERSTGVPLRARGVPVNSEVYLVMAADPAQVQSVWPEVVPHSAPAGYAAVALNDAQGNAVEVEITASSTLGGAAVTLRPKAPLAPSTMYEVRAAVATAEGSTASGASAVVAHRVEGRFVTGTETDETAPTWTGPAVASLDTFTSETARGGCASYMERLTIGYGEATETGTTAADLRLALTAGEASVVLFGKAGGSYTVSNCDGRLFGWSADPSANPGAIERVVRVTLRDIAGNESQAYDVSFPVKTDAADWNSEGTMTAIEVVAAQIDEGSAEAEAADEGEVTEEGGSSATIWIILGLLVLGGIIVLVRRKN